MHRTSRLSSGDERGAIAVEMVIALIVLVPILAGIIGFGLIFSQQIALDNAVREAARKAVVAGAPVDRRTCDGIAQSVLDAFDPPGRQSDPSVEAARPGLAAVDCSDEAESATVVCAGSASGDALTVIGRYTSNPVGILTVNLASRAVYQCEFS